VGGAVLDDALALGKFPPAAFVGNGLALLSAQR